MNIFIFEGKRQNRRLISIIVLAVVCIVVYANSLFNGFVYDDYPTIVENPHIQEFAENIPFFFISVPNDSPFHFTNPFPGLCRPI